MAAVMAAMVLAKCEAASEANGTATAPRMVTATHTGNPHGPHRAGSGASDFGRDVTRRLRGASD